MDGIIYRNYSEIQEIIDSGYAPPTFEEIFNSWARVQGRYNYYSSKQDAIDKGATEALKWVYRTNPDRIIMTENVNSMNCFISPDKFENFEFKVKLSSSDGDDDTIGLVIAFERIDGENHTLMAVRNAGGMFPTREQWALVYTKADLVLSNTILLGSYQMIDKAGGWSNSHTWIRVIRSGDIIRAYTSQFGSDELLEESLIEVDLNSNPALSIFKGKKSYGYSTQSQANSTYLNVSFFGGIDYTIMIQADENKVWEYVDNSWRISSRTPQMIFGYIREVSNPRTQVTYKIVKNGVEVL